MAGPCHLTSGPHSLKWPLQGNGNHFHVFDKAGSFQSCCIPQAPNLNITHVNIFYGASGRLPSVAGYPVAYNNCRQWDSTPPRPASTINARQLGCTVQKTQVHCGRNMCAKRCITDNLREVAAGPVVSSEAALGSSVAQPRGRDAPGRSVADGGGVAGRPGSRWRRDAHEVIRCAGTEEGWHVGAPRLVRRQAMPSYAAGGPPGSCRAAAHRADGGHMFTMAAVSEFSPYILYRVHEQPLSVAGLWGRAAV
ncbi:hypothetical protein GGX14DRAFT_399867 [Mycena pura]|uniref:Uncharacterized protein n=1 Tax=Mycena pura TaxID=153505 RepID=A0AAD6V682_9AGAR|nr:hypothetical protein GGX14DRAFT_399867 [Mycena pura]